MSRVDSAMHDEISLALNQGFMEEEFKKAIVTWKNDRKTGLGFKSTIVNLVNTAMRTGIAIDEYDELEQKVDKLSVKEVNAALRKHIDPSKIGYIFAGDFERERSKSLWTLVYALVEAVQ